MFLSYIAFSFYYYSNTKERIVSEVEIVSEIVRQNIAPLILIEDLESLDSKLKKFIVKDSIVLSCVYDLDGKVISKYSPGNKFTCPKYKESEQSSNNEYGLISKYSDVELSKGNKLAILYLASDLREVKRVLAELVLWIPMMLILTMAIAYLLAVKLERFITKPIDNLSETAKQIKMNNYSKRARIFNDDEIGNLAQTFNDMMDKIEKGNTQITKANQTLENKVAKRTAELEHALKARNRFISNMNHELRTPNHHLNSFSDFLVMELEKLNRTVSSILADFADKAAIKTQLDSIITIAAKLRIAAKKETRLITNLNSIATLNESQTEFHIEENNLSEVVAKVASEFSRESSRIVFKKDELQFKAFFDNPRIATVLEHLISNALIFAKEGDVVISAKPTKYRDKNGKKISGVKCTVSDSGVGIPEDELEFIFGEFCESSITKNEAGGRGLGLAICREIINAHNGIIWAENNSGGGASFHFVLPS